MSRAKEMFWVIVVAVSICWAIDTATGLSKWEEKEPKSPKSEQGMRIDAWFMDNGIPSPFSGTIK